MSESWVMIVLTFAGVSVTLGVAVVAMLLQASTQLARVATKLDLLCDRLDKCEKNTERAVERLHERVDAVESRVGNIGAAKKA